MEQLAAAIAQENVGIACAFIQKNAAEKAVNEMDKRLSQVSHKTSVLVIFIVVHMSAVRNVLLMFVAIKGKA